MAGFAFRVGGFGFMVGIVELAQSGFGESAVRLASLGRLGPLGTGPEGDTVAPRGSLRCTKNGPFAGLLERSGITDEVKESPAKSGLLFLTSPPPADTYAPLFRQAVRLTRVGKAS